MVRAWFALVRVGPNGISGYEIAAWFELGSSLVRACFGLGGNGWRGEAGWGRVRWGRAGPGRAGPGRAGLGWAGLRLSRFENVKSGGRVFGNVLFQSVT